MSGSLLQIDGLRVALPARARGAAPRTILRGVDLTVAPGRSVGLVGESGSGKSMTTKAVMGLLPRGAVSTGSIRFRGEDLAAFGRRRWTRFRAHEVSIIHQDPRAHTNPLLTLGDFLVEGPVASGQMSRADATSAAIDLLREIGIADAPRRMHQYPHELSGGLLQRMMIAMALLSAPQLVLADEPTTALDVTVQEEVVAILHEQIRERDLGLLFITHDLDLAAAICDTLAVMYAGTIVETGPARRLEAGPRHPYTAGLLRSRPSLVETRRMEAIPGRPLAAFEAGPGCAFAARCPFAVERCRVETPALVGGPQHAVACHRAEELIGDPRMEVAS